MDSVNDTNLGVRALSVHIGTQNSGAAVMNILMIDDHVMVLEGLKSLLGVIAIDASVDTAEDIHSAEQFIRSKNYDVVLLDWNLDECSGDIAIERMREAGCTSRIVVFSGETGTSVIATALEHGASGFIPKKYSSSAMLAALGEILEGKIHVPSSAGKSRSESTGGQTLDEKLTRLTPRQLAVYRCAARGLPNKLIARELAISDETVKSHLSAVYAVLGVKNRTEAVYQASREGFRFD